MDRLRLVVVNPGGKPGDELGAIVRTGDGYTFEGRTAEDIFTTVTRRTGSQDKAWAALVADGWSNGKLMLVPATDGQ